MTCKGGLCFCKLPRGSRSSASAVPPSQRSRRRPCHWVRSAGGDHFTGSGLQEEAGGDHVTGAGLQEETTSQGQICRRRPRHRVRSAGEDHATGSGVQNKAMSRGQVCQNSRSMKPSLNSSQDTTSGVSRTQSWAPLLATDLFLLGDKIQLEFPSSENWTSQVL